MSPRNPAKDMAKTTAEGATAAQQAVPWGIWRGSLGLGLGRFIGAAATATELIFAARLLLPQEFGRWTFLLAALVLVEAISDLGTGAAALFRGAQSDAVFASAVIAARRARRWTALAGAVLLLGLGIGIGQDLKWLLVACVLPLSRIPEVSSLVFQRALSLGPVVGARCVGSLARGVAIPLLLFSGVHDVGLLLAAHAAGLALGNVIVHLAAKARRLLPPEGSVRLALWSVALPLGLASLTHQAALYADNWVLRSLRGEVELGRYNAAARIASVLLLFAVNASTVALPWLAAERVKSRLGGAVAGLARGLLFPSALLLGLLFPHAARILATTFGPAFSASGPALQILLLSVLVVTATTGWLTALVASGSGRSVLLLTAAALVANILGNLALVPSLGGTGAALATLGTEVLLSGGAWVTLRTRNQAPHLHGRGWCRAAGAFLAAAFLSNALWSLLSSAS